MSRPAKSATTAPKSLPPHPRLARGHRVQRGHDRNRVRGRKDQPVRRSIRDWPQVGGHARDLAGTQLPDRCPKLSKEGTVTAMAKLSGQLMIGTKLQQWTGSGLTFADNIYLADGIAQHFVITDTAAQP